MQDDLRFIQFLLNLHDTIRLLRILVLQYVFLQLRESEGWGAVGERGPWVLIEKFVHDFGEKLVGD